MEYSRSVLAGVGDYNGTDHLWRLHDGRLIEFGAVQYDSDWLKWKGRAHDLKGFDELTEFPKDLYLSLSAWARTTVPGQRVRIVGATNPPTDATGEWVIERWAPWLDRAHSNPAQPGELRWYAMLDGEDTALETGDPIRWKGEVIQPRSRTFIPSRLADNPYLALNGYGTVLQNTPEPLRSQLLEGNFDAGRTDQERQVIPTAWVLASMERWRNRTASVPIDQLGIDVARGGKDFTVIAISQGDYMPALRRFPGSDTPSGTDVAQNVIEIIDHGNVAVDETGVGAGAVDVLRLSGFQVRAVVNSAKAPDGATNRGGNLTFKNARSYGWWKLREMLDPDFGATLALPDDRKLLGDLTAPTWTLAKASTGKLGSNIKGAILIESKDEIRERLHRSTDDADAVILAVCFPVGFVQRKPKVEAPRQPGYLGNKRYWERG